MSDQPQATILFLRVSGEQAVQSASEVLSRMLSGMIPPEATAPTVESLPAPDAAVEPVKRITRRRKVKYQKPDDEPDGFRAPAPAPTKAVAKNSGEPKRGALEKGGGGIGSKIVQLLDRTGGVAALESLVMKLGLEATTINRAVGHSDQLQRLSDGRIALVGWHDDED